MKFKMNNKEFEIKKVSKNEMWGDAGEAKKSDRDYLGKFNAYTQEIWLSNDLSKEQEIETLIHELIHCYMWCYCTHLEQCDEEDICNIGSKSHFIIDEIIERYKVETNSTVIITYPYGYADTTFPKSPLGYEVTCASTKCVIDGKEIEGE